MREQCSDDGDDTRRRAPYAWPNTEDPSGCDVFQRPQLMKIRCLLDVFKWPPGLVIAGTT